MGGAGEPWRPLSARSRIAEADVATYDALHDGTPDWLRGSLVDWIRSLMMVSPPNRSGREWTRGPLRTLERTLRMPLNWHPREEHSAGENLIDQCHGDVCLDVVDYLLSRMKGYDQERRAQAALSGMLRQAGSLWTVSPAPSGDGYRLVRRVEPTVEVAAQETFSRGRAGAHLHEAWQSAFGREPNASHAYREAVRAVESAAQPVVSPTHATATLGTMIAAMRDAPHKWRVALANGEEAVHPVDVARQMAILLWKGQHDRHGTAAEDAPLSVDLDEAAAAVHLAVLLVQWFTSGAIARVEA
jgi:hypothetical protein